MRLFILLLLAGVLGIDPSLAQTQLLRGQVIDAATRRPVPFATVGVRNQPIGTAADSLGRFRLATPAPLPVPGALLISSVGYETAVVAAERLRADTAVVRLRPALVQLPGAVVRGGRLRTVTLGRTGAATFMRANMYTEPSRGSDELAREQGTIIRLPADCQLRRFHLHVAFNRFRKVKFRLNLYRVRAGMPAEALPHPDIVFDVTEPRGWVEVDLEPYQLRFPGLREVAVTIQWLQSETLAGQAPAFGISAVPTPGHAILTRSKSQAQWQQLKPGHLSFYFTADSYGRAPGKKTEPDVLPDSLRYLAFLAPERKLAPAEAGSSPYGRNAATGRLLRLPGTRLYYETYGQGEPLLLLHGNGQSIQAFQHQIGAFARHFRVIAVDTRGHGLSQDSTTQRFSYDLFADDLRQLLDSLHLREVRLLGWSDGGNTALTLALRHPAYVRQLAVMGANLFPTAEAIEADLLALFRRQLKHAEAQSAPGSWQQARRLRLLLEEPQLRYQQLGAVAAPALVMAGEHDVIREAHTRAIARHLPQGQLLILPKATHYAPQEVPEAFNEAVLKFFGR